MGLVETIILTVALTVVFSIASIYIHHQRKSKNHDGFTYWFTNVDELL